MCVERAVWAACEVGVVSGAVSSLAGGANPN